MSIIKARKPELLKSIEFYQLIIYKEVTADSRVLPFALIKDINQLCDFFLHHNLKYLSYEAKQLLKTGVIKLPPSV